ncbi:hypothetical protein ACF0H5_009947 [Mactra antiquata]
MKTLAVISLCIFVTCLQQIEAACPTGSSAQGSYCFIASKSEQKYTSAWIFCKAAGCNLAVPDTTDKRTQLKSFMSSNSIVDSNVFFGSVDAIVEGTWVKSPTGETWSDINWATSEPSGGSNQNCLSVKSSTGTWEFEAKSCGSSYKFICECDAV